MKKFFALVLCLLMFLGGCAVESVETGMSKYSDEVKKNEDDMRVDENKIDPLEKSPIIYSENDILADDSSETVIKYNSIYALDFVTKTIFFSF